MREHVGQLLAGLAAPGDGDEFRLRMVVEQPGQLGPGVSRHVYDSDFQCHSLSPEMKSPHHLRAVGLRIASRLRRCAIEGHASPPHTWVADVVRVFR